VLILKAVVEEQFRRRFFSLDRNPRCPVEAFGIPPPGVLQKRLQAIDLMGVDFLGGAQEAARA
jgi:hypothetical protein